MKEFNCVRRSLLPRKMFSAAIIFALLSALFIISPVQVRTLAQTPNKSDNQKSNNSPAASSGVVISQVYGGAGCGTAGCSTYKNDYIELFNRGSVGVSLSGWSVQYAAGTGTTTWAVTSLASVTLQPGQYYLVAEGAGPNGVNVLPAPDSTGTIAMSATAGKVALVNTTTALSGQVANGTGATIVDFVGYGTTANGFEGTGPAPAPSTTTADLRAGNGCTADTDQNAADFATGAPTPRNTGSTLNPCGGTGATTISINNVSVLEGNSGTTTATFTVSLSAPAGAGGVTFDIATADGTATVADNDYVTKSSIGQMIAAGSSSYTFTVTVNGDTNVEPNETFFVNVTNAAGATPATVQGTGTIINDETTSINQIQGSGSRSPLAGSAVTTSGIVTATKSNGFFLQTPDANADANPNTSEGIFVFTSSAPPAAVVIGNSVNVSGTVSEFVPTTAPNQPPVTEIVTPTVSLITTGNPLPAPVTLTAADTTPNNLENLERFEGMRVRVNTLTVVAPTQGNITESSASVSSTGLFFGVIPGVARPFREPGIDASINPPAGAPANVPRFDTNPERLRIESDTQPGAIKIDVAAGETVSNIVGPLDYAFVTWSIYPDAATPPTISNVKTATPVPVPTANEFTVGSFNMQRFFDTVDDPGTSDPILTTTAFNGRLNKASLAIRNVMLAPDVIGVEEMENLTTLQAVANKVNNDAVAAGQPNPGYQAFLVEGNDVGGIDVGFLVKTRVTVIDVTQVGKTTTYTNPNNGAQDLLNDRPPLVLRASIQPATGAAIAFTVIVNHLRSLSSVDDPVDGNRIRTKRQKQAEFLANYIQGRQTADPTEKIISVGDYNAFQFNDGYVDSIGTIIGAPTPADQVTLASSDLVNPNLTDLLDFLPASERYSFTFDGNAQVLDHEIINNSMLSIFSRVAYARNNGDFPQIYYSDFNRSERISDHDMAVAYFSLAGSNSSQSIEGDVLVRPNGDGFVDSDDIQQIRRFSLGLDVPNQSNEFQRADDSPRLSSGDGFIDADDIQQARRYSVGTDATQLASGPSSQSPIAPPALSDAADNVITGKGVFQALGKQTVTTRDGVQAAPAAFRVDAQNTSAGATLVVPIRVDTVGNEAGYTFSIAYDSTKLTNPQVVIGNGGGDVIFNANNPGIIGFSVTSFSGGTIAAANNVALVNVTFTVAAGATGTSPITFTNNPARQKASGTDPNNPITQPTYTGGTITIGGATAAGATVSGRILTADGRGIRNATVTMTNPGGETRTVNSSTFGYFRFADVPAGQTYIISAAAKRYKFGQPTQVLNLSADNDDVNFTALP